MSKFAIAGLLGTLVAIAWWLSRTDDLAAPRHDLDAPPAANAPAMPSVPTHDAGAATNAPTIVRTTTDDEPAAAVAPRTLAGTFVVTDEEGRLHAALDGTFTLLLFRGTTTTDVAVAVTAGRWQAAIPGAPTSYFVDRVRLGERVVATEARGPLDPAASTLELRGRWLPSLRLRVLDAASGAELDDVTIVMRSHPEYTRRHPGNGATVLVERARSPVAFQPAQGTGSSTYHVRAPGRAWDCIAIRADSTEVHEIQLAPGGDLDVLTRGPAPRDAILRVRELRYVPGPTGNKEMEVEALAEMPLVPDGPVRIEGLPTSRVAVRIGASGPWPDVIEIGRATTDVPRNGRQTVVVDLQSLAAPPRVPLAGTLFVSPRWPEPARLVLRATGATKAWQPKPIALPIAEMQRGGDGTLRWNAGLVPAGTYESAVVGIWHQTSITVGANGDRDVRIVVPDPFELDLGLVDLTDGQNLLDGEHTVAWSVSFADKDGAFVQLGGVMTGSGTYHVLAPGPRVHVTAQLDGYVPTSDMLHLREGTNAFTLRARREFGLEIVLMDGDTEVAWPADAKIDLVDGSGTSRMEHRQRNRVRPQAPGDYTLIVSGIDGYTPCRRTVTVPDEGWAQTRVPLVRSR